MIEFESSLGNCWTLNTYIRNMIGLGRGINFCWELENLINGLCKSCYKFLILFLIGWSQNKSTSNLSKWHILLFNWVRHQQKTNRWLVKVIIFHYMSPNLNATKIFSLITIAKFEASGLHIIKILDWYVYAGTDTCVKRSTIKR